MLNSNALRSAGKVLPTDESPVSLEAQAWAVDQAFLDSGEIALKSNQLDSNMNCIRFNADGTRAYLIGNTGDRLFQLDLSEAWSINTAVYSGGVFQLPGSVSYQGFAVSSDGTRMLIVALNNTLYHYQLTTAWDVTTAVLSGSRNLQPLLGSGQPTGVFVASTGLRLFVSYDNSGAATSNRIRWVTAAASVWLHTTSYTGQSYAYVFGTFLNPRDVFFSSNGLNMYAISRATKSVVQYSLGSAWTLSTGAQTYVGVLDVAKYDATPTSICFSADGTRLYALGIQNNTVVQFNLSVAWDIRTATVAPMKPLVQQETSPRAACLTRGGRYLYVAGESQTLDTYRLDIPYALATAVRQVGWDKGYAGVPQGVHVNPTGTLLFTLVGTVISAHTLLTPGRPSTASGSASSTLDLSTWSMSPTGFTFSQNGYTMFVSDGSAPFKIMEFQLTTPFDLSTASHYSDYVAGALPAATDICCDDDGEFLAVSTLGSVVFIKGSDLNPGTGLVQAFQQYTTTEDTAVRCLAMSADGRRIIFGGSSASLYAKASGSAPLGVPDYSEVIPDSGLSVVTTHQLFGDLPTNDSCAIVGNHRINGNVFAFDGEDTFWEWALSSPNQLAAVNRTPAVRTYTYGLAGEPLLYARPSHQGEFILARTTNGLAGIGPGSQGFNFLTLPAGVDVRAFYISPNRGSIFRLQFASGELRLIQTTPPAGGGYSKSLAVAIASHPVVNTKLMTLAGYNILDFIFSPDGMQMILTVESTADSVLLLLTYTLVTAWDFPAVDLATPFGSITLSGTDPVSGYFPFNGKDFYIKTTPRDYRKFRIV